MSMKLMRMKYNHDSEMPHGFYKGIQLKYVPAGYLLLIFESMYNNKKSDDYPLSEYIYNNISKLKLQKQNESASSGKIKNIT